MVGGGVVTYSRGYRAARVCPFKGYLTSIYPDIAFPISSLVLSISKALSDSIPA